MAPLTKSDLIQIFKDYGVVSKKDMPNLLKDYGVTTKKDLTKLERSLSLKITKSKNDLANRIANVAVAKAERNKVEKLENRLTTLENFQFS